MCTKRKQQSKILPNKTGARNKNVRKQKRQFKERQKETEMTSKSLQQDRT